MLVALPTQLSQSEEWIYNLTVEPKCRYLPRERIGVMNRLVTKVWEDSNEDTRPQSVTVHLLRNDQVVDTVVLNDENRWTYKWQDMSEEYEWRVVEEPVEGYTVSVELSYNIYVITNTGPDTPDEPTTPQPDEPKLPQTGMLWWPVTALAALGLFCIVAGCLIRRGEPDEA